MKKLLALLLALLTLASLSACKKDDESEEANRESFRREEVILNSYTDGDSVYYFEMVDTETVAITDYSGPTALHEATVPSVVYTGEDKDATAKTVVAIAEGAFKDVSSIKKISIPEGVTTIGKYAFAYCAHLETVEFPSTLATIGEGAFYQSGLTTLTFPQTCQLTAIDKVTFSKCDKLTEVTIPSYIKTVGESAFFKCESLTKITLSEGVESVALMGFYGCPALVEVNLPSTLQNTNPIVDLAFLGGDALRIENVNVPEEAPATLVTYVESMALYLKEAPASTHS